MTSRRTKAQKRRQVRQRVGLIATVLVALVFVLWQIPWLLLALLVVSAAAVVGVYLWKADRQARTGDKAWREQDRHMKLERSMTTIDAMSWQDFEHYVAELCRRDGCRSIKVVGGAGDLAADIIGELSDGRRLVVQVKHYAPHRSVPSGDMQKFVGMAFAEHQADIAVFVATCEYSTRARQLALKHNIVALNRDLFGSWNNGATLESLLPLSGLGAGTSRIRKRRPSKA
ncbi:restriction endonuclease [Streptomyces monticola]|uniref:Restriction endonuclease n=1 Tax=Streptomyces monticola TaxID=2666263 RepID=A0ABW2JNG7_9ACTN